MYDLGQKAEENVREISDLLNYLADKPRTTKGDKEFIRHALISLISTKTFIMGARIDEKRAKRQALLDECSTPYQVIVTPEIGGKGIVS